MDYLRTPDDRFNDLAGYPFQPNYLMVDDTEGGHLRVHYLDEGSRTADPVLLMHGEPSWSYLYRKMIPILTAAGHRVIAPDMVGFGKSDKPTRRSDYTYQRHVDWMSSVLRQLDLQRITLVCQDWGGLIGLRLWAEMPGRFARIVIANTALPTGDQPMSKAFEAWQAYSQQTPDFNAGKIVFGGTVNKLTDREIAAYNAPFPDDNYKQGARQFPLLVPVNPNDPAAGPNRAAWQILRTLDTPVLTLFGAEDKVMAGVEQTFQRALPGASGQPHLVLSGAGHFLQEDVGPEVARLTLDFIDRTE